MSAYHVNIGGQSYGPAEIDDLEKWHLAGQLSPGDFVWDDTTQAWIEAGVFPPTAPIFARKLAPVEINEREIPIPPETSDDENKEPFCFNHQLEKAIDLCPKCQRSFCARCMVSTSGGIAICVNCIGDQKGAATKGWKRTALVVAAFCAVIGIVIGAWFFFGSEQIEQPAVLEKIHLERRDLPVEATPDTAGVSDTGLILEEDTAP